MSYGVRLWNDGGVVTIDSESIGPVYIGRPTLIQAGGPDWSYYNPRWQYYLYRITLPRAWYPPLVFVSLQEGRPVHIAGVSPLDLFTWDIRVYSALADYGNAAWADPFEPELFVFAPPGDTPQGQYGMALYDAQGRLTWDFSRRPMWIRQLVSMPEPPDFSWESFYNTSFGLAGGISKPAILGSPNGFWSAIDYNTEQFSDGHHTWLRSGGTVYRRPALIHKDIITTELNTFPTFFLRQTRAVIIDAAGL